MFYKRYIFLIVLILISVVPILDLFKSGLPVTHDGQDHVARIANFYQNLSEGNIIPRWARNLNWGYGHPILEFLYPLPSYVSSIFHFLGFTLVDSVKLVFGMTFILSSVAMYIFVKELLSDEKAAFSASLLYVIAPYRFVDLYVRGAIGEHVAFIFPPLVFFFLLRLSKRYSSWHLIGGAISLAGLNLSHNAISLMFVSLFVLYSIFLIYQSKNRTRLVSRYLMVVFLGFGLSAFFWIPAFAEGKYTLRDIVTGSGEYSKSFVVWRDFFIGGWSYGGTLSLSKQIGIIHWVGIFISVIATYFLYRNKNKLWIISASCFLFFWITLFLMTDESNPIWQSISLLQKFQFPWRFLSLTVFISAVLGAISFHQVKDKYKIILLFVLALGLFLINKDYWHANGFLHKEESFYKGIYEGTTDTGESAPIWSVRFMEKRPKFKIEIIEGNGEVKEIERNITERKYQVKAKERIRVLENTLYFPGWVVLVDGKDENVQFQDAQYRGLITFYVNNGDHAVNIIYRETKIRLFSNIISLVSLIITAGLITFPLVRKMYNKR